MWWSAGLAAAFCDRIRVMHGGEVVALGTSRQVPAPALFTDVYRVDAKVSPHQETGIPQVILRIGRSDTTK